MKQLCNLQIDVQMQENGRYDLYINNEGDSGCHYTDITTKKIGELVIEAIKLQAERY